MASLRLPALLAVLVAGCVVAFFALRAEDPAPPHDVDVTDAENLEPEDVGPGLVGGTGATPEQRPVGSSRVAGLVLDPSGRAVAGHAVRAHPTRAWPRDALQRPARDLVKEVLALEAPPYAPWTTTTDENGRFFFETLPADTDLLLEVSSATSRGTAQVRTSHDVLPVTLIATPGAHTIRVDVPAPLPNEWIALRSRAPRARMLGVGEYGQPTEDEPQWRTPWHAAASVVFGGAPSPVVRLARARPGAYFVSAWAGPDVSLAALSEGTALRGVVRDASGAPVADAYVLGVWSGPSGDARDLQSLAWTRTTAEGAFTCTPRGAERLRRIVVVADDFLPHDARVDGLPAAPLEIVLHRGATIHGSVLAPDGTPIEGATLRSVAPKRSGVLETVRSARTDATGRYRIHAVRPGGGRIQISAPGWYAAEGGHRHARGKTFSADAGDEIRIDFTLHRAARLRGFVRDANGSGVAGAWVWAREPRMHGGDALRTLTDADGAFDHASLSPGRRYFVHAQTRTQRSPRVGPLATGGDEPLILTVEPACVLAGRVLTADDKPVSGRQVKLLTTDEILRTDDEGRFRFAALAPGEHVVFLPAINDEVEGDPVTRVLKAGDVVEDLVFRAAPRHALVGRVVDERGKPLIGAPVATHSSGLGSIHFNPGGYKTIGDPGGHAITDATGRFEIRGLFDPARYVVYVRGAQLEGTFAADDPTLVLTLPDKMRVELAGTVVGPTGRKVAAADVTVVAVPERRRMFSAHGYARAAGRVREGAFELELWTSNTKGEIKITNARDADGTPLPVSDLDQSLDDLRAGPFAFTLEGGRQVRGRVLLSDGAPAVGASVAARVPYTGRMARFATGTMRMTTHAEVTTGSDGRFTLSALPSGDVTLRVTREPDLHPVEHALGSDETDVTLTAQPARLIRGRVVDEAQRPIHAVYVMEKGQTRWGGHYTQTGEDGTFVLRAVDRDAEEVTLKVTTGGYAGLAYQTLPAVSASTSDPDLVITMRRGHIVEGVVVGPRGEAVMDGMVTLRRVDGGKGGDTEYLRGQSHRLEFGPQEPGAYELEFSNFPYGQGGHWMDKPLRIEVPGPPVRLVLRDTWAVQGRVDADDLKGFRVKWIADEPISDGENSFRSWRTSGWVREDGEIWMREIREPAGRLLIRKDDDDRYALVRIEREHEPLTIHLQSGAPVRGKLKIDAPFEKAYRVRVVAKKDGIAIGGSVTKEGDFTLRGLSPGVWQISATSPRGPFGPQDVEAGAEGVELLPAK